MRLSGTRDDGFTRSQRAFFVTNMKYPSSPENNINLVGFRMTVDSLILTGFKAV